MPDHPEHWLSQNAKKRHRTLVMMNCTMNSPTPFLWQAPPNTQKTQEKENQAGKTPQNAAFWWFSRAISQPGWTSRGEILLGILLSSARRSHTRIFCRKFPVVSRSKKSTGNARTRKIASAIAFSFSFLIVSLLEKRIVRCQRNGRARPSGGAYLLGNRSTILLRCAAWNSEGTQGPGAQEVQVCVARACAGIRVLGGIRGVGS